ncbi:MAG: hypothetical protein VX444_14380 [Pseudomonadota bacterium]|nr:hypothetical protein [Pseudomonadota bacterium]
MDSGPILLPILIGVLTGIGAAAVSSYLGPKALEKWRADQKEKNWAEPRKKLLKDKLTDAKGDGWIRFSKLMILTGTTADECRSLLIDIEARGGLLKKRPEDKTDADREGWALISRQPLSKPGENVEDMEDKT